MIDFDFNTYLYLWGTQVLMYFSGVGMGYLIYILLNHKSKEKK
jgi:hypothetical protein